METRRATSILLVEDEESHAYLIRRHTEHLPAVGRIDRVADGQAALDYLFDETSHPHPDLVLLDLQLPRVSGLEVLGAIKSSEALRSIPVVVLTTSDADKDVTSAYQLQANGYIVKPVDPSAFGEMLASVVRYWLTYNYHPPQNGDNDKAD